MSKWNIYSIGHSNRSIEAFLELLVENEIELLVDVRTIPMSRYNPQFNKTTLETSLRHHGIEYLHLAALGGLRGRSTSRSHNDAWEHASFRNYADYAETEPFRDDSTNSLSLRRQNAPLICAPKRSGGDVIAALSPIISLHADGMCSTLWPKEKRSQPN